VSQASIEPHLTPPVLAVPDIAALGPSTSAAALSDALVAVAASARWPSGQLLIELDELVIRGHIVPALLAELDKNGRGGLL